MSKERFVDVGFQVEKDGNSYSSFCPELKIPSYGDTASEATENLVTASLITFAILREHGKEQEFFTKKGIPVQTVELDKKSSGIVIQNADQKGRFRLLIDSNKSPTGHEVETTVKNLS